MCVRRFRAVACVCSLAVFLACLPAAACADIFQLSEKLREDTPLFRFELTYDQRPYSAEQSEQRTYDEESAFFYVHSIAVIREDTGSLVQRIDLNPAAESYDDSDDSQDKTLGFVLEDMNFDGYLDMRVMQFVSAGSSIPYYCWLWDPAAQRFVYNEALSAIPSPIFDSATGQVHGFGVNGDSEYIETVYAYRGGAPVLVRRVTTGYDYGSGTMITTTEELVDGQLQVTGTAKTPFLEQEDEDMDLDDGDLGWLFY